MKKINYLLGVGLTSLVLLGSCTEYEPSESVEKLRDSYSEKLNSESSLILANADLVKAQAEVETAKVAVEAANAAYKMAEAADMQAAASIKTAEAAVISAEVAVKEAEALQILAENELITVQKSHDLAQIEIMKAESAAGIDAIASKLLAENSLLDAEAAYKLAQAEVLKSETDASVALKAAQAEEVLANVAVKEAQVKYEEAVAANKAAELSSIEAANAIKEAEAAMKETEAQAKELELQEATAKLATALASEASALQDAEILLAQNKMLAISDSITTALAIQAKIDAAEDAAKTAADADAADAELKELTLLQDLYSSYSTALSQYQRQEGIVAIAMSAVNNAKSAVSYPSFVGVDTISQYDIDRRLLSLKSTLALRQATLDDAEASLAIAETVMEQQGVAAKITALNAEIAATEALIEGYVVTKDSIYDAFDVDAYEASAEAYIQAVVNFQNVLNPVALGEDPRYTYDDTYQWTTSVLNGDKAADVLSNDVGFYNYRGVKWSFAKVLQSRRYDVASSSKDTPAEALSSVKTTAENALSTAESAKSVVVKQDATYDFVVKSIDTLASQEIELQAAMQAIFDSYDLATSSFDQAKIDAYNAIIADMWRLTYYNMMYPERVNSDLYNRLSYQQTYINARGGWINHYPRVYTSNSFASGTSIYVYTSYNTMGQQSTRSQRVSNPVLAKQLLENDAKWRAEDAALRVTDFEDYGWHQTLALNLAEKQAAVDAAQAVLDAIDEDQWIVDYNAARVATASAWASFETMSEKYDALELAYDDVETRINNIWSLKSNLASIVDTELAEIKDAYEISGSSTYSYDELVSLYFEELISQNEDDVETAEYNLAVAEESLSDYEELVAMDKGDFEADFVALEQDLASAELALAEAQRLLAVYKEVMEASTTAYESQVDVMY